MDKKLFYVAQYFTPEPYLKDIIFVNDLKSMGWDPVVITAFPNYPKGKIYDGYQNKFFHLEEMDGVKIIRVFTYAYHGLGLLKRGLNYFIFAIFSSIAILKYGRAKSTYYILQSSPFVVFCAWTISLFKWNSQILLDIQDVFPENIRISGMIKSKWIISLLDFCLNNFYYRSFDLFVVVSNGFKQILISKKIAPNKIQTVFNWSLIEKKSDNIPNINADLFDANDFNVVYAGNVGMHQGLSKLAEAFNLLPFSFPSVKLHIFGDGTDLDILLPLLKMNTSVIFHGRVNSDEIGKYLESADILFLHLLKDPVYKYIVPSKLQAYIEIGKPLLGGLEGEAKNIILDNKLGEVFEPENGTDFLLAIKKIMNYDLQYYSEISKRSKNVYNSVFSRHSGVTKINKFLQSEHAN